jgi:polysaccharide export outer membrane protein
MLTKIACLVLISALAFVAQANEQGDYQINPGDVLEIMVWDEDALSRQARVRPDGFISLPLAGEFRAGGVTPAALAEAIKTGLGSFMNDDPTVTVTLIEMSGNIVYVLGKVNRPGAFPVLTKVDVTQALAWAGGLNAFADEGDIQILRRLDDGTQRAISFDYGSIKNGEQLETNILLQSGDVLVVP